MSDDQHASTAVERLRIHARLAATLGVWAAAAAIDVFACNGIVGGFDADFARLMELLRFLAPLAAATIATAVMWHAERPTSDFEAELARIVEPPGA